MNQWQTKKEGYIKIIAGCNSTNTQIMAIEKLISKIKLAAEGNTHEPSDIVECANAINMLPDIFNKFVKDISKEVPE